MGKEIHTIRVSGGGAKSALWRQIQADIFDASVVTMEIEEGPAAGAAILAAVGCGFFFFFGEGCSAIVKTDTQTDPIPENVKRYNEYFELYHSLYRHLKEPFDVRAGLNL